MRWPIATRCDFGCPPMAHNWPDPKALSRRFWHSSRSSQRWPSRGAYYFGPIALQLPQCHNLFSGPLGGREPGNTSALSGV